MTALKRQLLSGVMHSAIAKYAGLFISLAVTALLSRLLPPSDFGTVAIATVLIQFFSVLSNAGIASALIQYKGLTPQAINELFMATVWMSLALALLLFASAGPVAALYDDPRLAGLCRWLSVGLLITSIGSVPNTLFYRDKRFKYISRRTLAIQLAAGAAAVASALGGMGIHALLVQPLLSALLSTLTALNSYPQRWLWTTGISTLKRIGRYSLYQFLFDTTSYLTRNLDKLLMGKFIGMPPLAYYERAGRLTNLPLQNITHVITPVLHPLLADYQDDSHRLAQVNERMVALLALIGFPLSALLHFAAPECVLLLFGSQWQASIPLLRILSLGLGFQLVLSSSGSFYQAGGYTRGLFLCGVFGATATASAVLCGVFLWGTPTATATCLVISVIACFIQCYALLYRRLFRTSPRRFCTVLLRPFLLGIAIAAVLALLSGPVSEWPTFLALAIKTATAAAMVFASGQWRIIKN